METAAECHKALALKLYSFGKIFVYNNVHIRICLFILVCFSLFSPIHFVACHFLHFSAPHPTIDPATRERWIQNIRTHQKYVAETGLIKICHLHFDPKCISKGKDRHHLTKGSLPTIFPERKTYVHMMKFCYSHKMVSIINLSVSLPFKVE